MSNTDPRRNLAVLGRKAAAVTFIAVGGYLSARGVIGLLITALTRRQLGLGAIATIGLVLGGGAIVLGAGLAFWRGHLRSWRRNPTDEHERS